MIAAGIILAVVILNNYPIAMWDLDNYAKGPVTFSFFADQGMRSPLEHLGFGKTFSHPGSDRFPVLPVPYLAQDCALPDGSAHTGQDQLLEELRHF